MIIQVTTDNRLYCFAADSTIQLVNGEERRMDKLQLEDFIKCPGKSFSGTSVSPITGWLHRMEEVEAEFVV